jgi:hypothetical protein
VKHFEVCLPEDNKTDCEAPQSTTRGEGAMGMVLDSQGILAVKTPFNQAPIQRERAIIRGPCFLSFPLRFPESEFVFAFYEKEVPPTQTILYE